jgi:hypothetical protein
MKMFTMMMVACFLAVVSVQAGNMHVEFPVTTAATNSTSTIGNFDSLPFCELESIHIAFPPVSTSTVTFYATAKNGVTRWAISDSMLYTNATSATVTLSYYPRKSLEFVSSGSVTNVVFSKYPVGGIVSCVISKTGTASQAYKAVLCVKTE